jgi:HipA-like protein
MADSLGIWLRGERVADLEQPRWPQIRVYYDEDAFDRWPLNSPVLSCSLPLEGRPLDATAFCVGLLPEGQALDTMASRAGLAANDTFALLGDVARMVGERSRRLLSA